MIACIWVSKNTGICCSFSTLQNPGRQCSDSCVNPGFCTAIYFESIYSQHDVCIYITVCLCHFKTVCYFYENEVFCVVMVFVVVYLPSSSCKHRGNFASRCATWGNAHTSFHFQFSGRLEGILDSAATRVLLHSSRFVVIDDDSDSDDDDICDDEDCISSIERILLLLVFV